MDKKRMIDKFTYQSNIEIDSLKRVDFRLIIKEILANVDWLNEHLTNLRIEIRQEEDFRSKFGLIKTLLFYLLSHGVSRCEGKRPGNLMDLKIEINNQAAIIDWVDNGIGLTPNELYNFSTPDSPNDHPKQSLNLARYIVALLHGKFAINSSLEIGTHIKIKIPKLHG